MRIKKYYIRKRILLRPMEDKLKLNRECEKKFKRGNKPTNIAKYYLQEKQKIENREREIRRRLKNINLKIINSYGTSKTQSLVNPT